MTNLPDQPNRSEIILYQAEDGRTRIEVRVQGETVWLSLNQMAELFQRDKSVISRHIRNVFEEGELPRDGVVAYFATTATDGKTYQVEYFNLDVIILVGYRVKSHRGTQFRIWATLRLREYIVKGFTLDNQRLKQAGGAMHIEQPSPVEKHFLEAVQEVKWLEMKSKPRKSTKDRKRADK